MRVSFWIFVWPVYCLLKRQHVDAMWLSINIKPFLFRLPFGLSFVLDLLFLFKLLSTKQFTRAVQPSYVYRGQSKSKWSLEPSLTRLCKELGYDEKQAIRVENRALRHFKSRAHLHLVRDLQNKDLVAWWSEMQHYRAPTRVLDWTSSPLVALYFAVNESWEEDGAIWSFHVNSLVERSVPDEVADNVDFMINFESEKFFCPPEGHLSASKPLLLFAQQSRLNERMVAQQGSFTVSQNVLADHADEIERIMPQYQDLEGNKKSVYRSKWIIEKTVKRMFLKRLHSMNVTAATLFPGIDGLGNELAELVRLSK